MITINEVKDIEPLLTHRFYVESDYKFINQNVSTIELPKFQMNTNIDLLEQRDLRLTLFEIANTPVSDMLLKWIKSETIRPTILVTSLDAEQNEVYTWEFKNCALVALDFGTFDYNGGLQNIELVISPESQILHV